MRRIPPSQMHRPRKRGRKQDRRPCGRTHPPRARKLVQELLECEATDYLGRGHYEQAAGDFHEYRNGSKERHLDTAEGRIEVKLPHLRGEPKRPPFRPELWGAIKRRTGVLEKMVMVMEMYARACPPGISRRLWPPSPEARTGCSPAPRVSRITEALREEYEAFAERGPSGSGVVYLFADAVYESQGQQAGMHEGILVAWAVFRSVAKVFLHMTLGNLESYEEGFPTSGT